MADNVKINVTESAASKRLLKKVDTMITKLGKVMENLEKEEKLQTDQVDKTNAELFHIDDVMNAVRKVNLYRFVQIYLIFNRLIQIL